MALTQKSIVLRNDLKSLYTQLYNIQVKFGLTQTAQPGDTTSKETIKNSDIETLKTNTANSISKSEYIKNYSSLLNNWSYTQQDFIKSANITKIQEDLNTIYNTCPHDSPNCSCNTHCYTHDPCPSHDYGYTCPDNSATNSPHNEPHNEPVYTTHYEGAANYANKEPYCYTDASQCTMNDYSVGGNTAVNSGGIWACDGKQNPVYKAHTCSTNHYGN